MEELEVKSVDVLGSQIMAAQDNSGVIWVGVRWMCQGMGMSDGQYKRQITNIQKDLLLKSSGANLNLNKGSGEREVFCLKLDYLPIWLAKISITPTMQKDHPELADKLLEYQLKAKDILAEAFMTKKDVPQTTDGKIALLAQGHQELREDVNSIKNELDELKNDLPLFLSEAKEISDAAKRKGVKILGGKQSNAYKNKSLQHKVYSAIYSNLKYNFNVSTYTAIKRGQHKEALRIVNNYEPPFFLAEQIKNENAQQKLDI